MKYTATLALFLFFAACLFGVRYAEDYSGHYKKCTSYWMTAAQETRFYASEREALIQKLEEGERPIIDGQACPKLLAKHKDIITLRLKLRE